MPPAQVTSASCLPVSSPFSSCPKVGVPVDTERHTQECTLVSTFSLKTTVRIQVNTSGAHADTGTHRDTPAQQR